MIILEVRPKNAMEVSLVENDAMIKELTSDRSDKAFCVRILPRRLRSGRHFLDAHVADALLEGVTVDAVAITNQKPWCFVFRKRLDELLGRPLSRWMSRHVEVDDATSVVMHDHKREE